MAKVDCELRGDFDTILEELERAVLKGSATASLEGESDFTANGCRLAVRVYERYSMIGSNRVSLNITLLQAGDRIYLTAIAAGGSQAMLFKLNHWGEDAFLDCVEGVIGEYGI